jgi:hypothetical protein
LTRRQSDLSRHRRRHTTDGAAIPPSASGVLPPSSTLVNAYTPVSIANNTVLPTEFADMMKTLPGPSVHPLKPISTVYAPTAPSPTWMKKNYMWRWTLHP